MQQIIDEITKTWSFFQKIFFSVTNRNRADTDKLFVQCNRPFS